MEHIRLHQSPQVVYASWLPRTVALCFHSPIYATMDGRHFCEARLEHTNAAAPQLVKVVGQGGFVQVHPGLPDTETDCQSRNLYTSAATTRGKSRSMASRDS